MSGLSNDTKKHTTKSHETIPFNNSRMRRHLRLENPRVWQITMISQIFPLRNMGTDYVRNISKNSLLLSKYFLDMTNTVFLTFQTQYILDFSSANRSGTHGIWQTQRFSSLKMSLLYNLSHRAFQQSLLKLGVHSGQDLFPSWPCAGFIRQKDGKEDSI
jgi:hypothetical protein